MDRLRELADELSNPSVAKLLAAAKKRKINVTKAQVESVVKEDSTREVFQQAPAQKGAHAALGAETDFQADIIDMKEYEMDDKYILLVTNVFDRKTHGLPLESKKPQEVWENFEAIMRKFKKTSDFKLNIDAGNEWGTFFEENAKRKNIILQTKLSDPNAIAVSDAAVANIKKKIFRSLARKNTDNWVEELPKAEKAYNKTPHETLHGQSPEEVQDNDVTKFRLMQDNALKLRKNAKQLKQRQDRLMQAGFFRPQLGKQTFQRGFKPRFSGEAKKVDKIEGGIVISGGQRFEIARVMPTKSDKNIPLPRAVEASSAAREGRAKEKLSRFVAPLKRFLGTESRSMAAASTHLKSVAGFEQAMAELRKTGPGGFRSFVDLFPQDFNVSGPSGPGMKTISVKRRRLVGKQ